VVAWVKPGTDPDALLAVGADQVITSPTAIAPHSADAVFDTATLAAPTLDLIRDGGSYLAFRQVAPTLDRGVRQIDVGVRTDAQILADLVELVETDRLRLPQVEELPFEEVAEAHRRLAAGGIRDRLVLVP
jgi:NADPH2:quinone reductase